MTAQELFEFVVTRPDVLGDYRTTTTAAVRAAFVFCVLDERPPLQALERRADASESEVAAARTQDESNRAANSAAVDRYLAAMQARIAERPAEPARLHSQMSSSGAADAELQGYRANESARDVDERVFMAVLCGVLLLFDNTVCSHTFRARCKKWRTSNATWRRCNEAKRCAVCLVVCSN